MRNIALVFFVTSCAFAHATYTGYSGAPGRSTCASSCHGTTGGTLMLTGVPAVYQPLKVYTLVAKHNGGSKIANLNISTRLGTTTAAAGTLAAGTGAATYSVTGETGIRGSVANFDSLIFQWTAPAAGSGAVKIYVAGLQGTSKSGPNSTVIATTTESIMGVADLPLSPGSFSLAQNYPNPFNPSTTIRFTLPARQRVTIKIHDMAGREVAMLANSEFAGGEHAVIWNAIGIPSGSYVYTLTSGTKILAKSLMLLK